MLGRRGRQKYARTVFFYLLWKQFKTDKRKKLTSTPVVFVPHIGIGVSWSYHKENSKITTCSEAVHPP